MLGDMVNGLKVLLKKYKEIIMYLIVGGLTTVVSLGIYYGLTLTVLDAKNPFELQVSNVISWIGAVTFAFFQNKKYVFESHEKGKGAAKEAWEFFAARVASLILDMLTMFLLVTLWNVNASIAKLIDQVIIMVTNYILSKLWVFKK